MASVDDWSDEKWVEVLKTGGQDHIFENCKEEADLKRLLGSIRKTDSETPGGIVSYLERAKCLLKDSKEAKNAFEGCVPSQAEGQHLTIGTEHYSSMENLGARQLPLTCFVLVAGGLGERLGYPDIKVSLPVDSSCDLCYLEWYAKCIIAYQDFAGELLERTVNLPLVIMTSEDTHSKTEALLNDNKYFGLDAQHVTLLKQGKVPALMDSDARMATTASDRFTLETKPHGHGDIHSLLMASGLPSRWNEMGFRWIVFFQDTNALAFRAIPAVLGVSASSQMFMNSVAVPRKPGDAMGGICKLSYPNGAKMTVNVEYNQLEPMLRATVDPNGDTPDPETGNSRYPGNTNCFVVGVPRYVEILRVSSGVIPEFVNPKYADKERQMFKSPARLECMMQDILKLAEPHDLVGFTSLPIWLCFSPVKNNRTDAAAKAAAGSLSESALSGESDQYDTAARLLHMAATAMGCNPISIPEPTEVTYGGVKYRMGPRVVLMPSFGITLEHIKARLSSAKNKPLCLSQNSTLILEGDVRISGLSLDGTLIAKSAPGDFLRVEDLNVQNGGWKIRELTAEEEETVPADVRIRGFKIDKIEQTILSSAPVW